MNIGKREPIVEIDHDEDAFAEVVQQSERIAGRRSPVQVVICVSHDGQKWTDYEVFDSGTRTTGVRVPSRGYLYEVCRRAGSRYAKAQKRANI